MNKDAKSSSAPPSPAGRGVLWQAHHERHHKLLRLLDDLPANKPALLKLLKLRTKTTAWTMPTPSKPPADISMATGHTPSAGAQAASPKRGGVTLTQVDREVRAAKLEHAQQLIQSLPYTRQQLNIALTERGVPLGETRLSGVRSGWFRQQILSGQTRNSLSLRRLDDLIGALQALTVALSPADQDEGRSTGVQRSSTYLSVAAFDQRVRSLVEVYVLIDAFPHTRPQLVTALAAQGVEIALEVLRMLASGAAIRCMFGVKTRQRFVIGDVRLNQVLEALRVIERERLLPVTLSVRRGGPPASDWDVSFALYRRLQAQLRAIPYPLMTVIELLGAQGVHVSKTSLAGLRRGAWLDTARATRTRFDLSSATLQQILRALEDLPLTLDQP
ncbi:hypothetical protein EHF33_14125 [Deinococcus psychrotolerans]|uniref:Uncharacterized protein n=1 Tax=Deinococcus psychrotolerans TaxID=2489213 RepID=A0A3G8YFI9_9DEIO|nr:hypothetical protein [Deinococcus psychrotolerans]AZI44052.1 hypothetical protein EHF33_14125 [Deinococcus psychrotolerans]